MGLSKNTRQKVCIAHAYHTQRTHDKCSPYICMYMLQRMGKVALELGEALAEQVHIIPHATHM